MSERKTITANTIGNPIQGYDDDPWPSGHPAAGECVAILAFEVTSVDGEAENLRSYHAAPAALAKEGPIGPVSGAAQGISGQWTGCGTGIVVRSAEWHGDKRRCEVALDDPRFE